MQKTFKNQNGLSIIEVLVSIAVAAIMTAISISIFSSLAASQSLEKETAIALSLIEKARTNAINSVSNLEHGISFASSSITRFAGTTLAASVDSDSHDLGSRTEIYGSALSNATTTFYFQKLTGKPSATGTITIRHDDGSQKSIVIYATGYVEVQ